MTLDVYRGRKTTMQMQLLHFLSRKREEIDEDDKKQPSVWIVHFSKQTDLNCDSCVNKIRHEANTDTIN